MKRTLLRTLTLVLTLSLVLMPLCCKADCGTTYRVQSEHPVGYTYVYSRPTSGGECMGKFNDGAYVTAFWGERGQGDTGSYWYYCVGPKGVVGYIRSNNLVAVPGYTCYDRYVVRSVHPVGYTFMYSKPTSSGTLTGTYYDGTVVNVYYAERGQGDRGSTWFFCMGPDGALGFIRANNLAECWY